MSFGAFDEDEHERREEKNNTIDTDFDDQRSKYHGTITYDAGESTEALLDQWEQIKSE